MNKNGNMKPIYLYTRFERFWHWAQAALILSLLLTGFEIHGAWRLFGFEEAHEIHILAAWSWLVLYVFIVFWMIVTSEWMQYIPTAKKLLAVARYYAIGIFRGEPHPVKKSATAKHNPLQRLTYLGIVSLLLPFQMATGFLYYNYNSWPALGLDLPLEAMALLHTLGAFLILAFTVMHLYMTTTGHSVFAHIRSMFTGWEEVEADEVQDWEQRKVPGN